MKVSCTACLGIDILRCPRYSVGQAIERKVASLNEVLEDALLLIAVDAVALGGQLDNVLHLAGDGNLGGITEAVHDLGKACLIDCRHRGIPELQQKCLVLDSERHKANHAD